MASSDGKAAEETQVKHDSAQNASPSSYLGLNVAGVSPRFTPKSVTIAPHAETISPLILGKQKSVEDLRLGNDSPRKLPVKARSYRLSGRAAIPTSPNLKPLPSNLDGTSGPSEDHDDGEPDHYEHLVDQISSWIKDKREKRHHRKARKSAHREQESSIAADQPEQTERTRRDSDASDDSVDLDKLERIVRQNLSIRKTSITRKSSLLGSRTSLRKLLHSRKHSTAASATDTEALDNELHVPTCEVVLDNSKTLAYSGGASDHSDDDEGDELRQIASHRDQDAWAKFKFEITRLTHTLRVKGWRKVPMEWSAAIEVQRLSGALTNAVYVVSPPSDLPLEKHDQDGNVVGSKKAPPKLLLRIYGPQVEHLIDREAELAILRRLGRKRIGPRLLGTFANGRFEEYFHAKPLTPTELRDPDTSRQIAKRMRELHEGIELLDQERADGPFVWRNWDKWLARVEQVVTWMDRQVEMMSPDEKPSGNRAWLRRGYICGVPWNQFKAVLEQYRDWLKKQYGGTKKLHQALVFAHNDTQYGNILRQVPTGESPLLLPSNTHKQLIVIDFEYASANTPGLEFANHFTEWCYNYHDEKKPYGMQPNMYPTPEEQDRFIRAYLRHRPQFNSSTPKLTPQTLAAEEKDPEPIKRSTSSISSFMLDARTPSQSNLVAKEDDAQKKAEDAEVKRLMDETRMWRLANTAQWVAWGIVQAKVPGMPLFDGSAQASESEGETPENLLGERADQYKELVREQQADGPVEEDEEFDYLGYAQHRALFFWGDALQMGFIKPEDLSEETREKVKTVEY
ncbi:Putative choline kinase, protein kinase-like domain superfamily [Septoria linicola]|uniref:Choline kinase, protein kinase-like domain superfamily n=1 Tax=Septoria linicola TaxID=215465 RepID=A0A9Q9AHY7_9PEZI|nr:putative choline kinase, protein kinase-like domain superfamily [Septoria linicola]USW49729.1 Putative choline kinase, protein kinase-like domain superfamily [Septoria linicola]